MNTTANVATAAPEGFIEGLSSIALSPGWAKKKPQMWASPTPRHVPTVWRYSEARRALDEACNFVSPEMAERRNLIMVNPIEGNIYPTCQNLVAAYQLVMPGETARSHRHTPNALRLILDAGSDTYTVVNGVKVDMAEGDIVLTPSWQWHGHSNFGDRPAFWIDFLDVPLVQSLETMFFENHPDGVETPTSHDPDSPLRFKGAELRARTLSGDAFEFAEGGLKTIGLQAIGLTLGQSMHHAKAIHNSIFAVTEGKVRMEVEALGVIDLSRGDVLVVPCWHRYSIEGRADWSQLVRVNDEPAMRALGLRDVTLS